MIKPDYSKVKDLFLAYPKGFDKENDALSDFFEDLIGLIPQEIHQYIIVNNKSAGERIKTIHPTKNIDTVIIKDFSEIWLRDILGFNTEGDKIIKPKYKPDYYKNIYDKKYLALIEDQTREIIDRTIGKEIIDMPLIMDGGNLVTNGEIGIITNKIFRDNNDKSKEEVIEILKEYLGIRPIIIETSKYDMLGHSDGFVSFLNEKEICLAQYPETKLLKNDIEILSAIERTLQEEGLEVINIYDRPVYQKAKSDDNTKEDFIYGARGNYINFITFNDTIILPNFTLSNPKESEFHNQKNKEILSETGKKINIINTNKIGDLGGGCRCLSFTN